jgi:hypothetical protein
MSSDTAYHEYSSLKSEFRVINAKYCNVLVINASQCLAELAKLDATIRDNDPCGKCFYDKSGNPRPIYHHTFFHFKQHDTKSLRMMRLLITSFLATQNLCCAKLLVWTLADFSQVIVNDTLRTFDKHVDAGNLEIRTFNIEELCFHGLTQRESGLYSSFQSHPVCDSRSTFSSYDQVGFSDFVRFFGLL